MLNNWGKKLPFSPVPSNCVAVFSTKLGSMISTRSSRKFFLHQVNTGVGIKPGRPNFPHKPFCSKCFTFGKSLGGLLIFGNYHTVLAKPTQVPQVSTDSMWNARPSTQVRQFVNEFVNGNPSSSILTNFMRHIDELCTNLILTN